MAVKIRASTGFDGVEKDIDASVGHLQPKLNIDARRPMQMAA